MSRRIVIGEPTALASLREGQEFRTALTARSGIILEYRGGQVEGVLVSFDDEDTDKRLRLGRRLHPRVVVRPVSYA